MTASTAAHRQAAAAVEGEREYQRLKKRAQRDRERAA